MAGQNKEGGKDGGGKDKKGRDDLGGLVRRLADEVAALRADVATMKSEAAASPHHAAVPSANGASPSWDAATLDALLTALEADPAHAARLVQADDASAARIACALSSAPKVALARHLLREDELSAAQLGEKAGLTTGSLYHHLRELIHAEIIEQSARNRYRLTPRGRRILLLLFAVTAA